MPRIKGFVTFFDERFAEMTDSATPRQVPPREIRRPAARSGRALAFAGVALPLFLAACTGENSAARNVATSVGFATTVPPAKDFVVARRSSQPLQYIPVGRGGIERPVQPRDIAGVRALEAELDATRDRSEAFARRTLPSGAYNQPLPSVAAPPRPARAANVRPDPNAPESFPVNPDRARRMRDDARAAGARGN
jgi:hypothetical protein